MEEGDVQTKIKAAASPLFVMSNMLGIMTKMTRSKPNDRGSSRFSNVASLLYSFTTMISSSGCLVAYLYMFINRLNIFTHTFMFLMNVSTYATLIMLIGIHISMFTQGEKISLLFQEFGSLCEENKINNEITKSLYWKVRLALVAGFLLLFSTNTISAIIVLPFCIPTALLDFYGTTLTLMIDFIITSQVCFFTYLLQKLFANVNRELQDFGYFLKSNFYKDFSSLSAKDTQAEDLPARVRLLARRHSALCACARRLNARYGLSLLLVAAHANVHVLFGAYAFLSRSLRFDAPDEMQEKADYMRPLTLGWLTYFCSILAGIVLGCRGTANEANITATHVNRLLIRNLDHKTRNELQLFSMQLLHQRVQFSACGLFPLDFTLLYSVMGAVASYLIILVQFQLTLSEETNSESPINSTSSANITNNTLNETFVSSNFAERIVNNTWREILINDTVTYMIGPSTVP